VTVCVISLAEKILAYTIYADAFLRLYYIYTWISVKENVVKL
jgi:hypothetical protein